MTRHHTTKKLTLTLTIRNHFNPIPNFYPYGVNVIYNMDYMDKLKWMTTLQQNIFYLPERLREKKQQVTLPYTERNS